MPRKKRFGDLQRALNLLRPATSGDTTGAPPDAPAGTRLRLYQDWRKGAREVTYTRADNSRPISLDTVVIELFGVSGTANKASVPVSRRAMNGISQTGLDNARLGILTVTPTFLGEVRPAQITVYRGGARQATAERSKLTGTPYKPRTNSASYTYPFGKSGTDTYVEEAQSLIRAAKATAGVTGASVRPEDVIVRP